MKRRLVLPIAHFFSYCLLFTAFVVFAFGTVLLVKGIYNNYNTVLVEAKVMSIIENDEERYILVSYEVNNEKYINELPYFNELLDIGDLVNVYYYKDNPDKIVGSLKFEMQSIIITIIGLGMLVWKGLYFIKYFKEKKRVSKLIKNNKVIEAEILCVDEIEKDISFGVVPKVIVCIYKDKEFKSKYIWESANISAYRGHMVDVYYEDDDFKNYYVDYKKVK